jgi:hypothetical protein
MRRRDLSSGYALGDSGFRLREDFESKFLWNHTRRGA